jgi:lysophospholipase L1-like esterase
MLQKRHIPVLMLALSLVVSCQSALAQSSQWNWIGSWSTASFSQVASGIGQGSGGFTYVNIAHLSVGGTTVRLQLTNEYGTANLAVGSVQVAPATLSGGTWTLGTPTAVTFAGASSQSVMVPEGAVVFSDPITFNAPAFSNIAVSIVVPAQTISRASCHPTAVADNFLYPNTEGLPETSPGSTVQTWCYLRGIDVQNGNAGISVITLGDSITAGYQSPVDANERYPDYLAALFQGNSATTGIGVLNEGIVANQFVGDPSYNGYGPVGSARQNGDVFAETGASYLILIEGINDLGYGPQTTAGSLTTAAGLISEYQQVLAQGHNHGIKVFVGTLTPVGGSGYYQGYNDAGRESVNSWIRATGAGIFDGVIDFDTLLANNSVNPPALQKQYDSGDHLHPNPLGYSLMAQAAYQALLPTAPGTAASKK